MKGVDMEKRIKTISFVFVLLLLIASLDADFNRSSLNKNEDMSKYKVNKLPQKSYMVEGNRSTDIQKRTDFEQKRIHLFLMKINEYLLSNGFNPENVSFQMNFRNILKLNFTNDVYLNGKRLPQHISDEIFKIYKETCKMIRTRPIDIPNGINHYINDNDDNEG